MSAAIALCALLGGCEKKAHNFETKVTVQSVEIVARDKAGTPQIVEVNVEYPDCPGDQLETLQGNAEFTTCFAKYKVGEVLPATIEWAPTDFGHYDSEIIHIGDCSRRRDPRDARSYEVVQECTDVVVNGVELGGGSIRIHQPDVQKTIFEELLAIPPDMVKARFGYMLEAFRYGAPPHGGIALGFDRLIAILCGTPSIRDVIAFPKTAKGTDLTTDSPGTVEPKQLRDLHIELKVAKKE